MSFIRRIKKEDGQVYLAEVESKWIDGKVVQKHIRYIGKEVNKEAVISLSSKDIEVDSVKIYGPLLVLHKIAQKIKLPEILGEYSNEVMSMVYAHCLNYKSVRNMPSWYKRTDLNLLLKLEKLTQGRLVSAMDSINDERADSYQMSIFKNVKKAYKIDSKGIVYDVTNTYFYGKNCIMGKTGKSKDGHRQNDLIQVALATTQKEGIPVLHQVFDGNIHDSRTLSDIAYLFGKFKLRSGLLVYDRGIVSEKNLNFIGELGWKTLCGLPLRRKEKEIIKKISKKKSLNSISNMVQINDSVFYVKSTTHSFGSIKGKLAVCYNEFKKTEITEYRRKKILEAQKLRREGKQIDKGLEKFLTPTGRIRNNVIDENEEFDGYTCIFSTKNIPSSEMVRLYFQKDVVEKSFKTLKGVSNLRPIRCWLKKRVKAHVFICYLSCLLLSILKLNLKNKNINISPEQALEDLNSMYNVYFSEKKKKFRFARTVTLSKHQEKILRAIDPKIMKEAKIALLKT